MSNHNILLPSKPKIILEEEAKGVYEIEGLYPGYGHTLGNSLRRIMLSSLPGAAITSIKINGVEHEFSTLSGVKEDVLTIILNLKKIRFKMMVDEPQKANLSVKGEKKITATDIKLPGQVEIFNTDQYIATTTDKNADLTIELAIESGLGYMPKEALFKDKVEIGTIAVDAIFSPVRRVNYEVENMRVGNRTDFNRLRISIETDGTILPKEVMEKSIEIMIHQLKSVIGFKEEEVSAESEAEMVEKEAGMADDERTDVISTDVLKTRIEDLNLSVRTMKALDGASIRTVGGLARKGEEDLLSIDGLGSKGVTEIKRVLSNFGLTLKQ